MDGNLFDMPAELPSNLILLEYKVFMSGFSSI
jgi:hypothetical protein